MQAVVVYQLLRTVIMALVSAIPLTLAQEFVDGTLKKLVGFIKDEEGLTLQEAKDVVGNILFDLGLNATIVGGVMKTKVAIKTAEYFGFTAKGAVKKTLTGKAAKAAAKYSGPLEKFMAMRLINKVITFGGVMGAFTWLFVGIANVLEPGIYKPREANDMWQRFTGLRPFPEKGTSLSPGNLDAERFNDLARSLEAGGIRGFNDPINRQSRLYSREDLAAIIDYAYGKALLDGTKINDYRDILPLIKPYLIGGTTTPSPSSTPAKTSPVPAAPATVQVFTGVVSQGVLGSGLSFTPRPDDLIENADELQAAINNNVSSFLASLAGRVTYEIKVVSSVIVNGIRKVGTTQRVVSGYFTNGQPKYKSITNKFAVADLFLITDRGTRSKLTSIVLGPTDALKFQPSANDLISVANTISGTLVTKNTDDISAIVTGTPTLVIPPASPEDNVSENRKGYCFVYDGYIGTVCWNEATVNRLRKEIAAGERTLEEGIEELIARHSAGGPDAWANDNQNVPRHGYENGPELYKKMLTTGGTFAGTPQKNADESPPTGNTAQTPSPVAQPSAPALTLPSAALSASTLYEFFTALGKSLPTLAERAVRYEALQLGPAAFYTGTAEQNTRLLNALKGAGI